MAFNEEISQLTTLDTTHCDNFNNINRKLLENTLHCYNNIGDLYNLQTSNKTNLVEAINEVKRNSSSSTDIGGNVDGKISVHNQSTDSHPSIITKINNINTYIGIPYAKRMSSSNYNNVKETGVYYMINGTNAPGSGSWYLEVMSVDGQLVFQRAKCVSGSLISENRERIYDSNTDSWTQWKDTVPQGDINSVASRIQRLEEQVPSMSSQISSNSRNIQSNESKINVLSNERGYVDTKIMPEQTDFNNVIDNGNYWANAWTHKNIPTLSDGTRLNGVMNVYNADNVVYQFFHTNRGKWFREKNTDSWNEWTQLATTDKTQILNEHLRNQWTTVSSCPLKAVVCGEHVTLCGMITDGSRDYVQCIQLPPNIPRPKHTRHYQIHNYNNYGNALCEIRTDGSIYLSGFDTATSVNWMINVSY